MSWLLRSNRLLIVISIAWTASGCGDGPPPAPPAKPAVETYRVQGKVETSIQSPPPKRLVAMLFPGQVGSTIRQYRNTLKNVPDASNLWPYRQFQSAIQNVDRFSPTSAALTNDSGGFEFPEAVRPGSYFITVGIPPSRDVAGGQDLPRDWPTQLATELPVTIADRELKLAARSAWMLEFDVKNGDRMVTLRATDLVTWPSRQPGSQLNQLTAAVNSLGRAQKKLSDLDVSFKLAERKAQASGQPLDVKLAQEADSKRSTAQSEVDGIQRDIGALIEVLFPPGE